MLTKGPNSFFLWLHRNLSALRPGLPFRIHCHRPAVTHCRTLVRPVTYLLPVLACVGVGGGGRGVILWSLTIPIILSFSLIL